MEARVSVESKRMINEVAGTKAAPSKKEIRLVNEIRKSATTGYEEFAAIAVAKEMRKGKTFQKAVKQVEKDHEGDEFYDWGLETVQERYNNDCKLTTPKAVVENCYDHATTGDEERAASLLLEQMKAGETLKDAIKRAKKAAHEKYGGNDIDYVFSGIAKKVKAKAYMFSK